MYPINLLGARVIRFQVFVAYRPGERRTAFVFHRLEIFPAKARQCRAINFGVAAYIIMDTR